MRVISKVLDAVVPAALAAAVAISSTALPANARDDKSKAFTIANYPVEAYAKNAVAAKNKAHEEGQEAAFRSLLKRIVPVTAYARLDRLAGIKAADHIEGVSIRSERNSATNYIATLDFIFSATSVRTTLRQSGVPFIDTQAPQITLVPIFKSTPAAKAKPGLGDWGSTWQSLDVENAISPVKVASLKPEIHADTIRALLEGSGGMRIMQGEYNAQQIVAAVAELDRPAKRLHVQIVGRDAVGDINWKRSYRLFDGDVDYAMEYAAVVSLGVLEGRWKAVNASARGGVDVLSGPAQQVRVFVQYRGLRQWNQMRTRLRQTPGVEGMRVESQSARGAEVSLSFPGGPTQLANVLARGGLRLRNVSGDWLLSPSF